MKHRHLCRNAGFTLIELVVALAVLAVTASFAMGLVSAPPLALEESARRAVFTETAHLAMRQVEREWRDALPNSLRVRNNAGVVAIEHIHTLDRSIHARDDNSEPGNDRLRIGVSDPQFSTIGEFARITKPVDSMTLRIALHHTGLAGANAWTGGQVISPVGTRVRIDASTTPGEDRVRLTPAVTFSSAGASRPVYLVSGHVAYLCDAGAGTLRRYSGYTMATDHTTRDSDTELMAAGATRVTLATGVSDCRLASTVSPSSTLTVHDLTVRFSDGANQILITINRVDDSAG